MGEGVGMGGRRGDGVGEEGGGGEIVLNPLIVKSHAGDKHLSESCTIYDLLLCIKCQREFSNLEYAMYVITVTGKCSSFLLWYILKQNV